jgi:FixJ family two-component response regulator
MLKSAPNQAAMQSSPATEPTLFVVEDDRQMCQSLVALLETLRYRVQAFYSASGFIRFYRPNMPGCLLLDVQLPVQDGLAMYEQLLSEGKRLPVIFITAHANIKLAVAAMKTGAVEFLEKPFDRHRLVECIQKAMALDLLWRKGESEFAAISERIAKLTSRDRETLELILSGEPNKAIAAKLALTERAVEMRRAGIMRKLQVRSLAELLDLTISHRILSDLRSAKQANSLL